MVSFLCLSQEEYNFTGYVIDKKTGETLIGANIYNESSKQGAVSNSYGYFNLTIHKGDTRLMCSYIGYSTDTLNINIQSDINYNFNLLKTTDNLNEVILRSKAVGIDKLLTICTTSDGYEDILKIKIS